MRLLLARLIFLMEMSNTSIISQMIQVVILCKSKPETRWDIGFIVPSPKRGDYRGICVFGEHVITDVDLQSLVITTIHV